MTSVASTIGLSGMQAATRRVEAVATNVANAQSSGTMPGSPGGPGTTPAFQPVRVTLSEAASGGVNASASRDPSAVSAVYDPTSPNADAAGLVGMPQVDLATQAVDLIAAKVQYEASARIVRAARDMERTTLDTLA
ncbi:MAG: flagellar basal body rod C-terminal domain-containing protein [Alsobacter sp.]